MLPKIRIGSQKGANLFLSIEITCSKEECLHRYVDSLNRPIGWKVQIKKSALTISCLSYIRS